jgi:hypothetical protein
MPPSPAVCKQGDLLTLALAVARACLSFGAGGGGRRLPAGAKPGWDGVEMSEPLSALHCESFIRGVEAV